MNKRLILYLTLVVVILHGMLVSLYFLFAPPPHMIDDAPPQAPVVMVIEHAINVLLFPTASACRWWEKEVPFVVVVGSVPIAIVVNALVWAVIFERLCWLFRRLSTRHPRHECSNHNG